MTHPTDAERVRACVDYLRACGVRIAHYTEFGEDERVVSRAIQIRNDGLTALQRERLRLTGFERDVDPEGVWWWKAELPA